jgi:hypothetical protein
LVASLKDILSKTIHARPRRHPHTAKPAKAFLAETKAQ